MRKKNTKRQHKQENRKFGKLKKLKIKTKKKQINAR